MAGDRHSQKVAICNHDKPMESGDRHRSFPGGICDGSLGGRYVGDFYDFFLNEKCCDV